MEHAGSNQYLYRFTKKKKLLFAATQMNLLECYIFLAELKRNKYGLTNI